MTSVNGYCSDMFFSIFISVFEFSRIIVTFSMSLAVRGFHNMQKESNA